MEARRLQGWVPMRFHLRGDRPVVDWCYLGEERLTEPFFDHTIERQLRRPFNLFFQPRTPVEFLPEFERVNGAVRPAGFIFHWSRCGSTLITQMLAALERNVAVSEAGVIDTVLRARLWPIAVDDEVQIHWLRGMVSALGHRRRTTEDHFFIKFDSWHVHFLPLLRRAFPEVPAVFVYREPLEIMASQMRSRAAFLLPGTPDAAMFNFARADEFRLPAEEYVARVLLAIGNQALGAHEQKPLLLLNYLELPRAVETRVLPHFGVNFDAGELAAMRGATAFNAKNPTEKFTADTDEKRRTATPEMQAACEKWLTPLYGRLEELRLAQIAE